MIGRWKSILLVQPFSSEKGSPVSQRHTSNKHTTVYIGGMSESNWTPS